MREYCVRYPQKNKKKQKKLRVFGLVFLGADAGGEKTHKNHPLTSMTVGVHPSHRAPETARVTKEPLAVRTLASSPSATPNFLGSGPCRVYTVPSSEADDVVGGVVGAGAAAAAAVAAAAAGAALVVVATEEKSTVVECVTHQGGCAGGEGCSGDGDGDGGNGGGVSGGCGGSVGDAGG